MEILDGTLLRVFISERDKFEGILLSDWIVRKARDIGILGATVFRAIQGYGAHAKIHNARIMDLSDDLPIVVEIVDSQAKIEALLPFLDGAIGQGLATTADVKIRNYRTAKT